MVVVVMVAVVAFAVANNHNNCFVSAVRDVMDWTEVYVLGNKVPVAGRSAKYVLTASVFGARPALCCLRGNIHPTNRALDFPDLPSSVLSENPRHTLRHTV